MLESGKGVSSSTPFRLQLPLRLFDEMVAHAQSVLPNECCGFLAGLVAPGQPPLGQVVERYALPNAAASPRRYSAETGSLFQAHRDMHARGLELLAVYHSHPTS